MLKLFPVLKFGFEVDAEPGANTFDGLGVDLSEPGAENEAV